jgi:hypothetical protein
MDKVQKLSDCVIRHHQNHLDSSKMVVFLKEFGVRVWIRLAYDTE